MLVLICSVLAIGGLSANTYTCPNGQSFDDTTVTFCSNVVHTSDCTLEAGGTCEVSSEDSSISICCFDSSNVLGTGEPVSTEVLETDEPDTTAVSSCDDDLRTCYDGCCDHDSNNNDESNSDSSSRRQLLHGHDRHSCYRQCESVWESCSGQSFSSELVDIDSYHGHGHYGDHSHSHNGDNDSSSEGTSEGTSSDNDSNSHSHSHNGNGHGHYGHSHSGDSSSSEENNDAYAGGSRILSFFIIPLFIMICISLCCCCFCKRVKSKRCRDVRTMSSIVSMQKTKNGHVRVPSNEIPVNTTSINGEGTIVTV